MHMYEVILTMKQYPRWVMRDVKYLEFLKKKKIISLMEQDMLRLKDLVCPVCSVYYLSYQCSAALPQIPTGFACFHISLTCKFPVMLLSKLAHQWKASSALSRQKNHQLTHAVCFPSLLLSAHYPFCTNGVWVFTSAVQLLKHFTKKLSSDTEEKVQNPSYPSYLSTDGGPPLSLKRCRGQSQGGDG